MTCLVIAILEFVGLNIRMTVLKGKITVVINVFLERLEVCAMPICVGLSFGVEDTWRR